MLDSAKIEQIAKSVATANLSSGSVSTVLSEPFIDSEGHDAVRSTIVLAPNSTSGIKGNTVLDTLVEIKNKLQRAGEDRFPLVEFATAAELEQSGSG